MIRRRLVQRAVRVCSIAALLVVAPVARADFSAQQLPIETGSVENAVTAADMDGDGFTDLVAVSETGKLTIELGRVGSFVRTTVTVPAGAAAVAAGDLDGDHKTDVVTANGSSISVVRQNAAGYTATTIPVAVDATGIAIGKLNGDDRPDIAVLAGAQVVVESQAADGSFTPVTVPLAASAKQIAIADFDGDGREDIAAVEATAVELLHQRADGGFDIQLVALPATAASALAAGDLDGDGDLDIAVTDSATSSVIVLTKGASGYTATTAGATGATPNAVAIADFDNDGTADIATSDATGITVLLHGYAPKTLAAPSPGSLALGDIDRDKRTDLVMTAAGSTQLTGLLNTTLSQATLSVAGPVAGTSFGAPLQLTATLTPVVPGQPASSFGGGLMFTVDHTIVTGPKIVAANGMANAVVRGLGVGSHAIDGAYIDGVRYQAANATATYTVTAARTLTGTLTGPIEVSEPTLIHDATIVGDVTAGGEGALDIERSTIVGKVDVQAGDGLRMCGTTVDGDVTAQGMSGIVLIGDAAYGCAVNRIGGRLTLTTNAGGVLATGNSVARTSFSGNVGFAMVQGQLSDTTGNVLAPLVKLPASDGKVSDTVLGSTGTATVDVANSGGGTLHVSGLAVTGDPAFTLGADTCSDPAGVAPDGHCSVEVKFTPQTAGAHTATLRVASDTATGVTTLPLDGRGLTPGTAALSTTSVAFPDTAVGASSATQTVTLSNAGDAPLRLAGDSLEGEFRVARDGCGSATLAPGQECSLDIAFAPASGGAKAASLRIDSSSPTSPDRIALSGNGVAAQVTPLIPPATTQPPPATAAGKLALSSLKAKHGAISFTLALPSAGSYTITTSRSFASRRTGKAAGPRSVTVRLTPTAAAKRALKRARKLKVTITVAFTPVDGKAKKLTKTLTVKAARQERS